MKALRNILNKILNALAGISFIAMVVLTCWQVFTRYVLQNPSSWSEDWMESSSRNSHSVANMGITLLSASQLTKVSKILQVTP